MSKSKYMICSRARAHLDVDAIATPLGSLDRVPDFRLLGVLIDRRLTLVSHFQRKAGLAKAILMRCRALFARHGSVPARTLRAIYDTVVCSSLLYAAPAVAFALRSRAVQTSLLGVARLAAIVITRCMRSCATGTVMSLAGVRHPADLLISMCCSQRRFASRVGYRYCQVALSQSPGGMALVNSLPMVGLSWSDLCAPGCGLSAALSRSEKPSATAVHVDGSSFGLRSGAAALCCGHAVSVRFDGACGPLVAELVAILLGLCHFSPNELVSDSMTALKLVACADATNPLAALCHEISLACGTKLLWLRRCSNQESAEADSLAKHARRYSSNRWGVLSECSFLKSCVLGALNSYSDLTSSGSRLHAFMLEHGSMIRYRAMRLEGLAACVVAGKVVTPALLFLMGRRASPACVCGVSPGDAMHAIDNCDTTARFRGLLPRGSFSKPDVSNVAAIMRAYADANRLPLIG